MARTKLDDFKALDKVVKHAQWLAKEGAEQEGINPESCQVIADALSKERAKISSLIDGGETGAVGKFDFSIDSVEVG